MNEKQMNDCLTVLQSVADEVSKQINRLDGIRGSFDSAGDRRVIENAIIKLKESNSWNWGMRNRIGNAMSRLEGGAL